MERANKKVICALDTPDLQEALKITTRLAPYVGAFKVGHALTLPYGLDVIDRLREAGANRIFLDLKFHDIPNSVALAVCQAARRGVWMMTLHISGGPAMLTAAVEEAKAVGEDTRPKLLGVSVLTSLDEHMLANFVGVGRSLEDQMAALSRLAIDYDLDGVVCSPNEVNAIRDAIGNRGIIVTPGIRLTADDTHDQRRSADAQTALRSGADYLVMGRALINSTDVVDTLTQFGLINPAEV